MRWLNLDPEERQTLTTYSMMGGAMALTLGVGALVYLIQHLPGVPVTLVATGLFKVIYAVLALVAIQIVAQAVIAIGGRMKAEFAGASIEAEIETEKNVSVNVSA